MLTYFFVETADYLVVIKLEFFPIRFEILQPSVNRKFAEFIGAHLLRILEGANNNSEQMLLFVDHGGEC